MIKMSFYNNTLKRDELKKFIEHYEKPILFTFGFEYRHPTTHRKKISTEEALRIVDGFSFLDAEETEEYLHLNAFSENDMW